MKKVPWPLRAFLWYLRKPWVGYLLLFLLAGYWGLAPRTGEAVLFNGLVLPWLALLLVLLNLPFVGGVAKRMRLSKAKRRNHALEHGTIGLLYRRYGINSGIGGRARTNGFRVSGVSDPEHIREAFDEFMDLPKEERWELAVAKNCGSMIVVSQGLGIILLLLTLAAFTLWKPSQLLCGAALGGQLVLLVGLRRPLGRWLQRNRLLSLDFDRARVQRIKKVRAVHGFERPPVYLVKTVVESEV